MSDDDFKKRETERADRLMAFVKAELLNMWVEARFKFTIDVLRYLEPEIDELLRTLPEDK